jgi:hypothetical protein
MTPYRRARRIVAAAGAALAMLVCSASLAEDPSKLYAGAGLAVADFSSDHGGVGYSASPLGLQLYGGLQMRERVGVELALDRLGGIDSGEVRGSGIERLRISADVSTVTVRGVFSLSLEDVLRRRQKITVFGTVGLAHSTEDRSVLELNAVRWTSVSERDDSLVIGAGVMFDLPRLRLRTHFQSVDRAQGGLNSVGAAAEFRF